MKITIYQKRVFPNALTWSGIEIECDGSGTNDDPLIIEPSEFLPKVIYLRHNNLFIHLRNLEKRYISLYSCQNITLTNCRLKYLDVFHCDKIILKNLSINKLFRLSSSKDVLIEDSNIEKFILKRSTSNIIRNSSFRQIKKYRSQGNTIESILISGDQVNEVKERTVVDFISKWNVKYLLYLIVLYIAFFVIVPTIGGFQISYIFHIFFVSICILIFILILRKER
jgi:hypothetical protein